MGKTKSEFGRGLVICLVKFAEHAMYIQTVIREYASVGGEKEHVGVNLWANGATDHLYDIEVPEGKDWDEIRGLVKELQDVGLDMGHGGGLRGDTKYTKEQAVALIEKTRKIALLIDIKIGINPDEGEF